MPRMAVGLVKTTRHKSNATATDTDDAGLEALLAQAADCMNNADAILEGVNFAESAVLAAA